MTNQPQKFSVSAGVVAPLGEVWDILSDPARAARLFGGHFNAELDYSNPNYVSGHVEIDAARYELRMRPYDIIIVAQGLRFDLNVRKSPEGCVVAVVVLIADESRAAFYDARVRDFLAALRAAAEPGESWSYSAPAQTRAAQTKKKTATKPGDKVKKQRRARRVAAVIAVFVIAAVVTALFVDWSGDGRDGGVAPASAASEGEGAGVNFENAAALALGQTKNEVGFLFGTNGASHGSGYLYLSKEKSSGGVNRYAVLAYYDANNALERFSYLDTETSGKVAAIGMLDFEPAEGAKPADIAAAAGCDISMIRAYYGGEQSQPVMEYHFGFLDPFANFNEAWSGESVLELGASGEWSWYYWGHYNGADPLMLGELEGTAMANQYDDYTEYLYDWHYYNRAQLLFGRYSRGDIARIFNSELVEYSVAPGARFYVMQNGETTAGESAAAGWQPAYQITVGLDSAGQFRLASYTNPKLFEREGMLEGSNYAAITRGMAYNEIARLMGVLPTAFTIDSNYFTVCYGRYLGEDKATEEQFEVVVRFGIEDNIARSVYINIQGQDGDSADDGGGTTWGFGESENAG